MFKFGQVWRNAKGTMISVIGSKGDIVFIRVLNGVKLGYRGWVKQATVINGFHIIGNNYRGK